MSQSVGDKGRDGTLGGVRTKLQTAARAAMVQAHEAAQVLSVAATAPARVIRSEYGSANAAPQAASRTVTARPVLLVHGFGGAKSSWALVAEKLSAHALFVETMSYPPLDTSVEKLADRLVGEVHSVLSRTGADKMHLVGHTLGGVIMAQALSYSRLKGRVDTVITLGSPFGGSPLAAVLPVNELVRARRPGSPLLRRLACAPLPDGVRWLSVTAALDVIVPGVRSVPSNAEVQTVTVDGVGHLGMLLSRRVIGHITGALCAREPERRRACWQAPLDNSAHDDRVLVAGQQLSDDGRAGNLTGDQQTARGLGVGEQQRVLFTDAGQVRVRGRPVEVAPGCRR